jgi:hypothetical protein
MVQRFFTFFLIALLTLVAVVAINQGVPNLVERAFAKPVNATVNSDVAKVTLENLLSGTSQSESRPMVRRTTVEGKYAIATWQWGEAGGQSILIQQDKRWKVVSAGGGAVSLEILKQQGIPASSAERLLQKEQAAQQR